MSQDRALPHNLEAERAILGAVLLDNQRLADVLEVTRPEDFYRAAHRTLLEHMVALDAAQEAIDLLTLRESLTRAGKLDDIGGPSYITALVDGVPRGSNVASYAAIVREKAQLRALIQGANRILASAYESGDDAVDIIGEAEKAILGLADRSVVRGFESMRTIAMRGLDMIERATQTKTAVSGVPSGISTLDDITRGWLPGKLITIGARPGMGKSSFAVGCAQFAALRGYCAAIASLEMEKDELFMRQVASLAEIDSHRLAGGYIGEREWGKVAMAVGTLAEAPLFIDETPALSLFELRSRVRKLKAEHGLRLLVVDYLQLMSAHEKGQNRTLELQAITSGLKALAKELKIPILLLSQLSRELEKRGGRPKLSDLRDSGSIEQDSDMVLFLWRDESVETFPPKAELIIAKHRGGAVGTVELAWFAEQTRFAAYVDYAQPQDQRLPVGDR